MSGMVLVIHFLHDTTCLLDVKVSVLILYESTVL